MDRAKGKYNSRGEPKLSAQVKLWPTPQSRDHFPPHTPEYIDAKRAQGHGMSNLNDAVALWPTPTRRDWRSGKASAETMGRNSRPLSETVGDKLNPNWVEWLMGWPIGWTALDPLPAANWQAWRDGNSWAADPADDGSVPRVSGKTPHRVARLKAIGNGQVPDCLALAWRILA